MHGLARTISVLGVLVLAQPVVVDAQSTAGWILWDKNVTWNSATSTEGPTTTTYWKPVDGYDALADCRAAGHRLFRSFLEGAKESGMARAMGDVAADARSATFRVKDQKRIEEIAYVCFPGTFDPRPR